MNFLKLLFSSKNSEFSLNTGLLVLRLFVGCFMLTHGLQKLMTFGEMSQMFPGMFGLSSGTSLGLLVFAEFGCSVLLILGLFSRLATIPLIIGMSVAAFGAHAGQPFGARELPLMYICIYICILFLGPGKCSLDYCISRLLRKKNSEEVDF